MLLFKYNKVKLESDSLVVTGRKKQTARDPFSLPL